MRFFQRRQGFPGAGNNNHYLQLLPFLLGILLISCTFLTGCLEDAPSKTVVDSTAGVLTQVEKPQNEVKDEMAGKQEVVSEPTSTPRTTTEKPAPSEIAGAPVRPAGGEALRAAGTESPQSRRKVRACSVAMKEIRA